MRRRLSVALVLVSAACATMPPPATAPSVAATPAAPSPPVVAASTAAPVIPPAAAFVAGLMPLRATGVDRFLAAHPTFDGRGVLIAILDSGIDPGVDGLIITSTGAPKILDLRDFSGEGRIALRPVTPGGDGAVTVGGQKVGGTGRVARLAVGATWYAGVLRELPLGKPPAADLNGNGRNTDVFPVIVVKAPDGWVAFIDSNLNGSLEDEQPLHDYRQGRQTIALGTKPVTLAANFSDGADGAPLLDIVFDTQGHGTHVAGIAAGHNMFNIGGFDGVAPGAQLIGLKIADDADGGISVTGSMQRAMDYAARFAAARNLPLVLNLSFGVGNELEGRAEIDSIVDAFLLAHPDVVFTISAGNDGPGLSTMGFPASADLAVAVGALNPGAFVRPPQPGVPPAPDALAWFSSEGGELAKPDFLTPGLAFSAVPRWNTGDEVKAGTSMAAPHLAGLAACLMSALAQQQRRVAATEVIQALRAAALPLPGGSVLAQGAGIPHLEPAYRWLVAGHQGSAYIVRVPGGGSAAFRRNGLAGPGDTLQIFSVKHAAGLRAALFVLHSEAAWLSVPGTIAAGPVTTEIPVTYRAGALTAPGVYIGTVTARNPNDTLAGPLFRLVNTVIVPHDLAARPFVDDRRTVPAGRVQRYFLRAPTPASTLTVSVTVADSAQHATLKLYEPTGQPSRGTEDDRQVGGEDGRKAVLEIRAEDFVPGVYELDIVAPYQGSATVGVRAEVGPVAIAPGGNASGGSELTDPGQSDVTASAAATVVGAERDVALGGTGSQVESLTVAVPTWANHAEVDVEMPREQWSRFTDFGVTVLDRAGQQVSTGPLNYAFGRLRIPINDEARAGSPWTVVLLPAFARANATNPWKANLRVRFLLPAPHPVAAPQEVTIAAGGRVQVAAPALPALQVPTGFQPLLEWRVAAPPQGGTSVRRLVAGAP